MISSSISSLDPLRLDSFFRVFPSINLDRKVNLLLEELNSIVEKCADVDQFTVNESHAAMRDIGMIMSGVRRTGIQPCQNVSGLESVLVSFSKKTNMVPRDTSYHYGPWNPEGLRERRFTNYEDEDGLINAVRVSIPGIESSIANLLLAERTPLDSPDFELSVLEASNNLKSAVVGIGETIRKTDPYLFSHELRPFFDPLMIGGKDYVGAGGGQMPLFVIDLIAWGGGLDTSLLYGTFINDATLYLPPALREQCETTKGSISLLEQAKIQIETLPKSPVLLKSLNALSELFSVLIKFRKPHYQLAEKTLSKTNRGKYQTGSAGYTNELTREVLSLTEKASSQLQDLIKSAK